MYLQIWGWTTICLNSIREFPIFGYGSPICPETPHEPTCTKPGRPTELSVADLIASEKIWWLIMGVDSVGVPNPYFPFTMPVAIKTLLTLPCSKWCHRLWNCFSNQKLCLYVSLHQCNSSCFIAFSFVTKCNFIAKLLNFHLESNYMPFWTLVTSPLITFYNLIDMMSPFQWYEMCIFSFQFNCWKMDFNFPYTTKISVTFSVMVCQISTNYKLCKSISIANKCFHNQKWSYLIKIWSNV